MLRINPPFKSLYYGSLQGLNAGNQVSARITTPQNPPLAERMVEQKKAISWFFGISSPRVLFKTDADWPVPTYLHMHAEHTSILIVEPPQILSFEVLDEVACRLKGSIRNWR